MIDVTCRCGHISHSEEQHIGKHLRCPECGEPVPILLQPPNCWPSTQNKQAHARRVRRFRPLYAVSAAIGIMVLAGSWLVVHFQNRANEWNAGTPSASDSGGAVANQKQSGGSQASDGEDQSIKWEVVDAAPIPAKPKRTSSSASALMSQDRREGIMRSPLLSWDWQLRMERAWRADPQLRLTLRVT